MEFEIRPADDHEAMQLSDLASRSKSYWPYEDSYLAVVRSTTHIIPEYISNWPVTVASKNNELCGFTAICTVNGKNMLDHLWIDPNFIGQGLGRRLFSESVIKANALGWKRFLIASDPYAEAFYLKMGAIRVGEQESKIKQGFFMPLLEYSFAL